MNDTLNRLLSRLKKTELNSKDFFAEAVILTEGLRKRWLECGNVIGGFYDRCRIREDDFKDASTGDEFAKNEYKFEGQS